MKVRLSSQRRVRTLVGLLGSLGALALDGLRDVVGGVGDGVGDLADDALVRLVNVGSRHVEGWLVGGWFERVGKWSCCSEVELQMSCVEEEREG